MATFVLVHGAYQGGWIWQHVANRMRAAGHQVYAPSLDGCGERKGTVRPGITTETQADEVAQLLFYEDLKDVVLVGTSSGGMVVCRVAELMRDRIGRLAFVDALALFGGERIRDIVTRSTSVMGELTASPSREDAANRLFADLDPASRAWALERYTPQPIGIYEQPVKLDSFWTQPGRPASSECRRAPNPGEAPAPRRRAAQSDMGRTRYGHYRCSACPKS
jgi:pimeloyl-ACP methyl ester carboxylesterase